PIHAIFTPGTLAPLCGTFAVESPPTTRYNVLAYRRKRSSYPLDAETGFGLAAYVVSVSMQLDAKPSKRTGEQE
ncbi:MAG TPA: hypothetical protein PKE45_18765, partial [Caldilineaceae bacterium]|nr:hypothetical protein [Caldilineaceae bacterium]